MTPTLKVGDKVRIINYGHQVWWFKSDWDAWQQLMGKVKAEPYAKSDDGKMIFLDLAPERVGREDIITKHTEPQYGFHRYALDKNGAWYSKDQLELINPF